MSSSADRVKTPRVSAGMLWLVLEALRTQDTPPDIHPDENPHPHMPQRLGMSDVILDQIRHYRRLGLRGRVPPADAVDLFRLVARRPDAGDVFDAAGRTLAERLFARRSRSFRLMLRILPRRARRRLALRHARAYVEPLLGAVRFHLADPPGSLHAEGTLGGRVGSTAACRLYTAFLEETLRRFTGARWGARHEACQAMSDGRCVWTALEPGAPAPERAPSRSERNG